MAHYGTLGSHRFPADVDDIRSASVYGPDEEELGKVDDVIFDHSTMAIRYLVVDSGGWFSSGKFLFPAERVAADTKHRNDLSIDATGNRFRTPRPYEEESLRSKDEWKKYEEEFKKFWHEAPVMH